MPLANKQISCVNTFGTYGYFYAKVDASGQPFSRVTKNPSYDSGWVSGFTASAGGYVVVWDMIHLYGQTSSGSILCSSIWSFN